MLYENTVSGYKTFIRLSWFPAQLSLKRRYRFIMSLDCSHARENRAQFPDPMQNFHRYRKTGLNIDDKERLLHDLVQSVYLFPGEDCGRTMTREALAISSTVHSQSAASQSGPRARSSAVENRRSEISGSAI